MPTLNHYLLLSAVLFAIGTAGVFVRRNLITILLSIEIMLNAVNLTFVAFGRALGAADGQIIVFFVMTVAAAEAVMLHTIPLLPFLGFLVNAGLGRRLTKAQSGAVACGAVIASFAVSVAA